MILNVGLQLSYLGTIGIILFQPVILKIFESYSSKRRYKLKRKLEVWEKAKEMIAVSLSAQIMILPILLYHFNICGIYFLITNLLVSLVIAPIIILGFFYIILAFILNPIAKFLTVPLGLGLNFLNLISKFSELPFSKIYIPTPSWIAIFLYFIGVLLGNIMYDIYQSECLTSTQKRVKNIMALFRYQFRQKKKKYVIGIAVVLAIFISISVIPKDLKIYFVDVGQGDCTLLVTPQNRTILIDGGGSLTDFDVGKKTLIPYLLDRGFTSIDYVFISHYDMDHVRSDC